MYFSGIIIVNEKVSLCQLARLRGINTQRLSCEATELGLSQVRGAVCSLVAAAASPQPLSPRLKWLSCARLS